MIIAFEGLDASGKRTQTALLADHLRNEGFSVATLSFPRYHETFFSESVADYLNGGFGALENVDPRVAAMLYAGDRYESRDEMAQLELQNDFLLLDRYVASNAAYQTAQVPPFRKREFIGWVEQPE